MGFFLLDGWWKWLQGVDGGLDGGWHSSCGMDHNSGFKMSAWLDGGLASSAVQEGLSY